jgi:transcriptional regulator with XRE-family HTH domain
LSKPAQPLVKTIRSELAKRGWSQEVLGQKVGVSRAQVAQWLRENSKPVTPGKDYLEKIAGAFGMTVSQLIGEESAPPWADPRLVLLGEALTLLAGMNEDELRDAVLPMLRGLRSEEDDPSLSTDTRGKSRHGS